MRVDSGQDTKLFASGKLVVDKSIGLAWYTGMM
jgi:hypothetical protein